MKHLLRPSALPFCTLICGLAGLALQMLSLAAGTDDRGLFPASQPTFTAAWILTAVFALLTFCLVRQVTGTPSLSRLFPASVSAAIGTAFGALGIGLYAMGKVLSRRNVMDLLTALLGLVCALCLVYQAYTRFRGVQPHGLTRIPAVVFFMVDLVGRYQGWSSSTQLQEYAFPLLACVFLMLTAYQRAALENNMCSRPSFLFCSQMAAFCSFLAMIHSPLFFLPMALWTLLDTCSFHRYSKRASAQNGE